MATKDKLDENWGTNETMDLLFEVRAKAENLYNVVKETNAQINELIGDEKWQDIDNTLRQTVTRVLSEIDKFEKELDKESEFLDWRQPK